MVAISLVKSSMSKKIHFNFHAKTVEKTRIWDLDPKCAGKSVVTESLMRARSPGQCFRPSIAIFRMVCDLEWQMPIYL